MKKINGGRGAGVGGGAGVGAGIRARAGAGAAAGAHAVATLRVAIPTLYEGKPKGCVGWFDHNQLLII